MKPKETERPEHPAALVVRRAGVAAAQPGGTWHVPPLDTLLRQLETSTDGLASDEAARRLERYGPNALRVAKPVSAWRILLEQFRSVVMALLVVAALIAWLLGDPIEAAAILAVLAINATIGFVTELRARTAMAALLRLEVPHATVMRDGRALELPATSLVPGDVILVEAGQSVPADARLVRATELRANEAALTGESVPADKNAGANVDADTPLAERTNAIYMSTAVVAGTALAVVAATGMSTEVGRIGGLVGGIRDERTPLEKRLDALGRRLVWVTLLVAAAVVVLGVLRGDAIGRLIETGLALAIAAVPEGLPAVSTIALAVGVARMARRNALVRRLPAVEALGSATTVCTDKTGTLTAGEMTTTLIWAAGREYRVTGSGYRPEGDFFVGEDAIDARAEPALERALRIGALVNRAALDEQDGTWQIRGDPTEGALLVAARKAGFTRTTLREQWPETGEVPFSSERMLMATFHQGPHHSAVFVKGAPARVLEHCTRAWNGTAVQPLDDAGRARILDQNRAMAARGLRVLALAEGEAGQADERALRELVFVGLVGLSDPPAPGVRETIDRFHAAGIRVVMVTGDQRLTAEAVARELGILRAGNEVIDGRDLKRLPREELAARMPNVAALSRVSPEDKLRIIDAFQRSGQIVAMLGDGVNDAAALKKADIGVAMGMRGTDVAKQAAAVVLQDDRFQTIGAAVEEGRVIYDNIRRFVFYLFSCNLAEIFVIVGAGVVGMPQPLLPLQILWLNLVTDTFPALSLAAEPGARSVMQRPPHDPQQAILSAAFLRRIAFFGLLITAATLGAFLWALRSDIEQARAVTIAFMTLALAQTFHLGNARSREPVLRWTRIVQNRWALAAVALTVALQLVAIYLPPLAAILDVVPLLLRDWLLILPFALLPAAVGQITAWARTRRGRAPATAH